MGIETAALIVAVAGTAYSAYSQHEAAGEQKKQAAYEKRIADVKNMRAQRDAIRSARTARANVINAGANTGTSGSSGVEGGASSVGAQLGGNLSYFGQIGGLQDQVYDSQQVQAGYMGNAAIGGALGQLGGTVFAAKGGWTSVMGGNKQDTGSLTAANAAQIQSNPYAP